MCCCFVVQIFLLFFPLQLSYTHFCLNLFEAQGAVEAETDVSASLSWTRLMFFLLIWRSISNTALLRQKNYHEDVQSLWIGIKARLEVTGRLTRRSFCSCSCTCATPPSRSHHWKSGARTHTQRLSTAWCNADALLETKVRASEKGLGDCWGK